MMQNLKVGADVSAICQQIVNCTNGSSSSETEEVLSCRGEAELSNDALHITWMLYLHITWMQYIIGFEAA